MHLPAPQQHIVITLGDDRTIVTPVNIPDAECLCLPADKGKTRQTVLSYIDTYPRATITFVLDNLGQDLRLENLPPVGWANRQKLAARRLKQIFASTSLSCFRTAPHDRTMLALFAVHEQNPVHAWLDKCAQRLPRVTSITAVKQDLIAQLTDLPCAPWKMLLSRNHSGGYRQIVFHNGLAVFTRLTPLATQEDEADAVAKDVQASLVYLTRLGLHKAEDLSVILLMSNADAAVAVRSLLNPASVTTVEPADAARRLRIRLPETSGLCPTDALFATLCARQPSYAYLRPERIKDAWLSSLLSLWGMRVALTCLALSLGATGILAGGLFSALGELHRNNQDLADAKSQLAKVKEQAGPLTGPLGRMRQAIERRRIFDQTSPSPALLLAGLSSCLGEDRIASLDWQYQPQDKAEFMLLRLAPAQTNNNDRVDIVAAFDESARRLAACTKGYTVKVTRTPYPTLPGDNVNADGDAHDAMGEIEFRRSAQ